LKAFVFFKGRSIIYKEQGQILLLRLAQDLEEKFKTLLPQIRSRKQLKKFDFFKKAIEKVKIR
jgi:translation initiation factor IF-3